jgi:hypothetical protein
MPKYSVPVTRRFIDVYIVEAKSPTAAGVEVGKAIALELAPAHTTPTSMAIGSAKLIIEEPTIAVDAHLDDVGD